MLDPSDANMGCIKSKCKDDQHGSCVYIYWQDPSVKSIGYEKMWIPSGLKPGPATKEIITAGMNSTIMPSDDENNYLYKPTTHPREFVAVNTVAVVKYILEMYRTALKEMKYPNKLDWQWQGSCCCTNKPIKVYPLKGNRQNAYYSRSDRALVFFYFENPKTDECIYTSRSFDVISHEAGHAILDSLKPRYSETDRPQTAALHESFGDLTSIFGLIDTLKICEVIIAECGGNLHEKSFISAFADEWGDSMGTHGIRNADNDKAIDDVTEEVHNLSMVFTGAIYDIIADGYEIIKREDIEPAEALHESGKHFCAVLIAAFVQGPKENADFIDIVEAMVRVEPQKEMKSLIVQHFHKRKVFRGSEARPKSFEGYQHDSTDSATCQGLCGTMELKLNPDVRKTIKETCKCRKPATHDNVTHADTHI